MNNARALVFVYAFLSVACVAFVWGAAQNLPPVEYKKPRKFFKCFF